MKTLQSVAQFLIDFLRSMISKEAARTVAILTALLVALVLKGAASLNIQLSEFEVGAVLAGAGAFATELVRRLVFSKNTTEILVNNAAFTGDSVIGPPPSGAPASQG